ncbi:Crossover junction endonuclease mus81 [Cyphellophora attinorum]|uniref:Crossover junction endonuclease MUS81 n=1 Tax=Cyphellophora attinorum TaxID=1664694 RepID=A0A0N1HE45_9EURO|nr:Crossover junction endonuclease mus81 [Phialophora attinorum]KPI43124.1 Crossover junction endonuclease mus81 [Phialophora attinorum]
MDDDCANPLLLEWLKEWMEEARERNSKGYTVYKKAYQSMKACPTTFAHPSEAQQLNGLGPKLCDRLTDKLKKYTSENGLPMPEKPFKASKEKRSAASQDQDADTVVAPKKRKTSAYVPKPRSGAFALIMALATLDQDDNKALSKNEVIELAQPHCDASFSVGSDTTKHYTAWSSMKTLETKELVCTKGHPTKRYYLSDDGWETANACKKISGGPSQARLSPASKKKAAVTQPVDRQPSDIVRSRALSDVDGPADVLELSSENEERHTPHRQRPLLKVPHTDSLLTTADTITLSPECFEVRIVLDSREVRSKTDREYIADELRKQGIKAIIRALPLGDVLWVAKVKPEHLDSLRAANKDDNDDGSDEIMLDYIVERKRLDDLISSIKDGRFHEQKFRLRKSGIQNVAYIVEAFSISAERSELYGQSVETAITSTQVINDIFVKQTTKLDETIKYLARMTRTLQEMYRSKTVCVVRSDRIDAGTYLNTMSALRIANPKSTVGTTFSAFQALCDKSDSMTLRDVYLKMLLCIRGVTADKAIEIQKVWPTPVSLIEAYESCVTAREREVLLSNKLGNAIPRKKIAKALSAKVAEVWYGSP